MTNTTHTAAANTITHQAAVEAAAQLRADLADAGMTPRMVGVRAGSDQWAPYVDVVIKARCPGGNHDLVERLAAAYEITDTVDGELVTDGDTLLGDQLHVVVEYRGCTRFRRFK